MTPTRPMIQFHGPYKPRRKPMSTGEMVAWLMIFAVLIFFILGVRAVSNRVDYAPTEKWYGWLSQEEGSRLLKHHGAHVLIVDEDTASIERNGEVIIVKRRAR